MVPVGGRLDAGAFDGSELAVDAEQPLNAALGLLVASFAEVEVPDDAVLIDEVQRSTGLSAAASTALSSNYLGILIGRLLGAGLTRRAGRSVALLYASLAITGAGFVLFWLTDQPALAILGLFLRGVGIANLYPFSLALTLDAAGGREDRANARSQMILGLVAAASPFCSAIWRISTDWVPPLRSSRC